MQQTYLLSLDVQEHLKVIVNKKHELIHESDMVRWR